jgi:short-subunit dehydrogenase
MQLSGRSAVITGASSGIGRAAALELARRGMNVALAARREKLLEEVAAQCRATGVRAVVVPCDVSDEAQCEALIRTATAELGPLHLLVNNAGYAIYDRVSVAQSEDFRGIISTNYLGGVYCTKAVLPQMLERREGAIVFVSSITGIMGFESMSAYCASKFAVNGFAESLRNEVLRHGIRVSMVCPATTETGFFQKAERGKMPQANRLILSMKPERVATAVAEAAERGSFRIIVPWTAAVYMKFKEIYPRSAHLLVRVVSRLLLRTQR